jgi:hypothetical protein
MIRLARTMPRREYEDLRVGLDLEVGLDLVSEPIVVSGWKLE